MFYNYLIDLRVVLIAVELGISIITVVVVVMVVVVVGACVVSTMGVVELSERFGKSVKKVLKYIQCNVKGK
jgi:hypothetical protein